MSETSILHYKYFFYRKEVLCSLVGDFFDIMLGMKNKPIRVGFDFDGVIAYNPARIVRPIIAYVKSRFFGVKYLRFWYPKARWQQVFWMILHESSIFPATGIDLFKEA